MGLRESKVLTFPFAGKASSPHLSMIPCVAALSYYRSKINFKSQRMKVFTGEKQEIPGLVIKDKKRVSIRMKVFLLSFIILSGNGFIGYSVYRSYQKLRESEEWVKHTERILELTNDLSFLNKDIERISRAYVISDNNLFLNILLAGENKTRSLISEIKKSTRDNAIQQNKIDSLEYYMNKSLDFNLYMAGLKRSKNLQALLHASTNEGEYYYERTSKILTTIQKKEKGLLSIREEASEHSIQTFNRITLILFMIMNAFTLGLIIMIGRSWMQNIEKEKRAAELLIANRKILFRNDEKKQRAAELMIANKELAFQNNEKEKRSKELILANKELAFQNYEKEKKATELIIANIELAYQNKEKGKRSEELTLAYAELAFQNREKGKRATELLIANIELAFQSAEKGKRSDELILANIELEFQNQEKEKRAMDLLQANNELREREEFQKEYIQGLEKMMYMISHEVRQPITHLLGLATLLEQSVKLSTATLTRIVNYIKESAVSLDKYTRDLTSFVSNMMRKGKNKKIN